MPPGSAVTHTDGATADFHPYPAAFPNGYPGRANGRCAVGEPERARRTGHGTCGGRDGKTKQQAAGDRPQHGWLMAGSRLAGWAQWLDLRALAQLNVPADKVAVARVIPTPPPAPTAAPAAVAKPAPASAILRSPSSIHFTSVFRANGAIRRSAITITHFAGRGFCQIKSRSDSPMARRARCQCGRYLNAAGRSGSIVRRPGTSMARMPEGSLHLRSDLVAVPRRRRRPRAHQRAISRAHVDRIASPPGPSVAGARELAEGARRCVKAPIGPSSGCSAATCSRWASSTTAWTISYDAGG